jgi:transposase
MIEKTKNAKKTNKNKKNRKTALPQKISKLVEIIGVEPVADIPLLFAQLKAMGIIELFDKHFPQHGNWGGELSAGEVIAVWLCFILSRGEHRVSQVRLWVAQRPLLFKALLAKQVRDLDFTDDRLAKLLTDLGDAERWPAFERELTGHLLRVYDLLRPDKQQQPQIVRVDSTTGKTYAGVDEDGLFQFGHSKDHRPDLPQVKINMAVLDPLGLTISTTVVPGQRADDPLYAPEIVRVRLTIDKRGLTYVGDSKMGALETRVFIVVGEDYYLCPLSLKQLPAAEGEGLVEEFFANQHEAVIVRDPETDRVIGVGFEIEEHLQAEDEGQRVEWTERRIAFRSFDRAESEAGKLAEAIARASSELLALNEHKQGKKRLNAEELAAACAEIVKRCGVEGIITYQIETQLKLREVRGWKDRPARQECEEEHQVKVELEMAALTRAQQEMGWSFYATNHTVEQLSLQQAVLAYRDQHIIERSFGRLKGRQLSLTPLYLRDDRRVTGLIHLLVIALRLLCVAQFVARRKLAAAEAESERQIKGLYAGQASRGTTRPTIEMMLEAFKDLGLVVATDEQGQTVTRMAPLNELQKRILDLLGFSQEIYLRLGTNFENLAPK